LPRVAPTSPATPFLLFRQRSGYTFRTYHRVRLWQEGYYDRVLRKEEDTFEVVSYILGNPVRAGLTDRPIPPYVGSSRYSIESLMTDVQWRPN
jgi:hypothetical protein